MKRSIAKETKFYRTNDLALATLISLYHPVESIDFENPRKAFFLFLRDEKLDQLVEDYWRGSISVEPKNYFDQLRQLKSRIYS